ncbi:hypothetical protein [Roseibium sp.]|uniref:hypothetical protein n=1 Tax=Roseibium sp. TaxID=1936156 RepID=UPI003BAE6C1D
MTKEAVSAKLRDTLLALENETEIVLATTNVNRVADRLCNAVSEETPVPAISASEWQALRALIFLALEDDKFFDREMPTLTGLTAKEFRQLADRLPAG